VDDAWLDGAAWRALERTYALTDEARKAWARRRKPARIEPSADPAQALRAALDRHGYTAAAPHAEALIARGLAPPVVVDYLLAIGDHARGKELATTPAHRAAFGLPASCERADGTLDAFVLARAELDADALRALLRDHPRALLRDPQLHLLVAAAERPRDRHAAAAALNRYLRARRLPRAALAEATARVLDDVWFPAPPRAPGGPLVSILVAAYRARDTIAYAIDSLLAQTYPDVEILVCDDASDDGTSALLAERYAKVARVRRFASARNQGPYNLRNALLPHARGALITFHDADDLALPTRIATQVGRLHATGADASFTTLLRVTPPGRFVIFKDGSAARLAMVSMMCERRVFDELGGFRPARFGADLDAYERLRDRDARLDIVRAPQLLVSWSSSSMTRAAGAEALDDGFRAPARRAYGDLLHARATGAVADADLPRSLQALGNWADPAPITPA